MAVKFDTRNKKPNIWNIAILSAAVIIVVAIMAIVWGNRHLVAISLIMDAYFAAVIVILINTFFKQLEYNPYSYNVIYYLGFSIFVLFVLVFNVLSTIRVFADPEVMDVNQVLFVLNGASRNFLILTSVFVVPFSFALAISNIFLIKNEGFRPVNLLGIFLGIFLIGGLVFIFFYDRYFSGSLAELMRHDIIMSLVTSLYLYFECMIIGSIVAGLIAAFHEPAPDKDFVIILGCGIRKDGTPTPILRGRIDRAIGFRENQLKKTGKDLVFITSGGKGKDEVLSESRCMHNYLTAQGIPEDHIIEENQSTSTHENMIFSKEKILAIDPAANIAFSTTNYHVFRSGLYARREKIRAVGMGAETKWYFWPNAAVREFAGILSEHRLKQAIILLGLVAVNILLVVLARLA